MIGRREAGNFTLVLDDYHVITDEDPARHGLSARAPAAQLHLILAARADPHSHCTSGQGQLTEVRAVTYALELSFSNGDGTGLSFSIASSSAARRMDLLACNTGRALTQGRADVSDFWRL